LANVIEIILQGRNNAGAAFAQAGAQTAVLRSELAALSPVMGGALGRVQGLAGAFGGLGSGAAAFIGVGAIAGAAIVGIGVAAVGAAKGLADTAEKLGLLSARTSVSAGDLQVYQRIIKENGGSVEGLATSLTFLNRAIGNNDPALRALGITTRDTSEAFRQLLGILASSGDTAANTAVGMKLLGRGSAEVVGQAASLTAGFVPMQEQIRATGSLITDEVLKRLEELDVQLDKSGNSWEGFINRMKLTTVPVVQKLVESFNNLFDAMNGLNQTSRQVQALERDIAALQKGLAKGDYIGDGVAKATAELNALEKQLINLRTAGAQFGPAGSTADTSASVRAAAGGATANKDAEARAAALAKIVAGLRATGVEASAARVQAVALYDTLQKYDTLKFGQAVVTQAAIARQALQDAALGIKADMMTPEELGLTLKETARAPVGQLKPSGKAAEVATLTAEQFDISGAADEARRAMADILSVAQMTREGLASVFEGLQSGFSTVFQGIVFGAMNLRQALIGIFQSLVSAILSELARLAAASVFRFLLSLLPGGQGLGLASVLSGMTSTAGTPGSLVPRGTAMAPAVTNVYNTIQTFSPRDTLMQYTLPSGVLRAAQSRMAMAEAY